MRVRRLEAGDRRRDEDSDDLFELLEQVFVRVDLLVRHLAGGQGDLRPSCVLYEDGFASVVSSSCFITPPFGPPWARSAMRRVEG
jgi:hypothetical protein